MASPCNSALACTYSVYILLCWGSGDAFGMRCRIVSEIEVQDLCCSFKPAARQ